MDKNTTIRTVVDFLEWLQNVPEEDYERLKEKGNKAVATRYADDMIAASRNRIFKPGVKLAD